MRLSSGTRHSGLVAGLIALHGPEDVEATPCEAQDRLGVSFALRTLAVVIVS